MGTWKARREENKGRQDDSKEGEKRDEGVTEVRRGVGECGRVVTRWGVKRKGERRKE